MPQLRRAAALALFLCLAAPVASHAQLSRYEGEAVVNGTHHGSLRLDLATVDASGGRVVAVFTAGNGLVGQGVLQGTMAGGSLRLSGIIRYEVANGGGPSSRGAFEVALSGRAAQGRITGRYHLTGIGVGGEQDATFDVASRGGVTAPAPAQAVVGTWNVIVGSSTYSYGSGSGRTQQSGAGAPAGTLSITSGGRFTWRTTGGVVTGPVLPYRPLSGGTAWLVYDRQNVYYAFVMPREPGTLYLFSPGDENERLRARRG